MDLAFSIQRARRRFGLTQVELASQARVSLPTVQNIESGRNPNPSIQVIEALFKTLKMRISVQREPVDWDLLAYFGVPISQVKASRPSINASPGALCQLLKQACLELISNPGLEGRHRKQEAIQSVLLALKIDYPTFFAKNLSASSAVQAVIPKIITGKHLKLRRIALSRLAEYL